MGGIKIIVVKLQQIIKSVLLTLAGLILIGLLVYLFIPKNKPETSEIYVPGNYLSQIILHGKPINIEVSVDENKICAIEIKNMDDYQKTFYPLLEPVMKTISQKVMSNQKLDVSTLKNSSFTEKILLSAINKAINQASVSSCCNNNIDKKYNSNQISNRYSQKKYKTTKI
jgi:uncharacterized protein with FMN-binding domain